MGDHGPAADIEGDTMELRQTERIVAVVLTAAIAFAWIEWTYLLHGRWWNLLMALLLLAVLAIYLQDQDRHDS